MVATAHVLPALPNGQLVAPTASGVLVVQDSKGRHVLVRIEKVRADVLTFACAFGTVAGRTTSVAALARVLGRTLPFPAPAPYGQVVRETQGDVSVSAGFDFETGQRVDTRRGTAGLAVCVASDGQTTTAGHLSALDARGEVSAWPALASPVPVEGTACRLVDRAGNCVLLQVTAVIATAVAITYRRLAARDVAVLPGGPVTL